MSFLVVERYLFFFSSDKVGSGTYHLVVPLFSTSFVFKTSLSLWSE